MSLNPHLYDRVVLALVLVCVTVPLGAQAGTGAKAAVPPPVSASAPTSGKSDTPARPLTAKELREAQIAADTEKLYQLAQELKVELDKSTKDTLSLTVVKKAAEIEKLAHSLSERLKSN